MWNDWQEWMKKRWSHSPTGHLFKRSEAMTLFNPWLQTKHPQLLLTVNTDRYVKGWYVGIWIIDSWVEQYCFPDCYTRQMAFSFIYVYISSLPDFSERARPLCSQVNVDRTYQVISAQVKWLSPLSCLPSSYSALKTLLTFSLFCDTSTSSSSFLALPSSLTTFWQYLSHAL